MKNQVFAGPPTAPRFSLCPSTVKAGDLVLVGTAPACALNDYQSNSGGATFYYEGTFTGTVIAVSQISPPVNVALGPGAALYATGTLDAATNVTTGLTISGASTGTAFGRIDMTGPGLSSGTTNTAANIRLGLS